MNEQELKRVALTRIIASRWQPRGAAFDAEELWGLACSIKENGLINPVVVFPVGEKYELVAGERRTRAVTGLAWGRLDVYIAAKAAVETLAREGLGALPDEVRRLLEADGDGASIAAKIEPAADLERLHRIAVVENLERKSLSAFEEAAALQSLAEEYGWSQRELAKRIGKSQSFVAQRLALMGLSDEMKEAVNTRVLTPTHARAIASVPSEMQPVVIEWAAGAVGREDTPATTRQVQNRARQVAAFVDPDRWLPNEEKVYRPSERNKLAMVREVVSGADLGKCGEALLALAAEGYSKSNWLAKKPISLVQSDYGLNEVLDALCGASMHIAWERFAEADGRTCNLCVLSRITLDDRAGMDVHCARWRDDSVRGQGNAKGLATCLGWIGPEDPVVIPLGYELRSRFGDAGIKFEAEPFEHVTDIAAYVAGVALASAQKREESVQREEQDATKHIAAIRAFADWQAAQGEECLAHFQAHACAKCVHQLATPAAPCRFALEPLTARYGSELRAPEFGLLVSEAGQMYPRCEQFAYRDIPQIFRQEGTQFASHSQAMEWLHGLSARGAFGDHDALWGVLRWLDYGRPLGQSTDFDKLKRWIKRNWEELGGDGAVATLLDVALSESRMRGASHRQPYKLLNPITSEVERFATVDWRAITSGDGYFSTYGYPEGWERPWEQE